MPADQYHRQRNQLMRKILKELNPIAPGLPEDFEPFCHNCGVKKSEANELHIDHPHGNPEETSQDMSGWDYYYMYRRQFQGEVTLWIVCDVCHYLLHKRRGDGGAEKLSNRRKYLDEYSQVDLKSCPGDGRRNMTAWKRSGKARERVNPVETVTRILWMRSEMSWRHTGKSGKKILSNLSTEMTTRS